MFFIEERNKYSQISKFEAEMPKNVLTLSVSLQPGSVHWAHNASFSCFTIALSVTLKFARV